MNDKEKLFNLLKELFPTEIEDTLETVADYLMELQFGCLSRIRRNKNV